ncbi:MAG TPA: Mov34/MPN/PAD-1 family protein [Gemmataceae bacterium]|nr:Mov34/MPN/PAD-1 family protein [Gemmataceae bacterium]
MLNALVRTAGRLWSDLNRSWRRDNSSDPVTLPTKVPSPISYGSLRRVVLTDEVGRTLFEEYAAHRKGSRGREETGWVLLGLREAHEAVVLATLPAGRERNAGVAHVQFNSNGQAVGSRIVRQADRRLTMLGVVHTHPGSLRHPSDGDFQGDRLWVGHLRGKEGIFGIGTADGKDSGNLMFARHVKPHVQCLGPLCFSWYALNEGDWKYRPLPCAWTLGPDLARPLHPLWATIETHAERLDRLCSQQSRARFELVDSPQGFALALHLPLAEPGQAVRVLLNGPEVRYFLIRDGEIMEAGISERCVDRGVYLLLAELTDRM